MTTKVSNIKLRKIRKSDRDYFLRWWKDEDLIALTSGRRENAETILNKFFSKMLDSKVNHYFMIVFKKKPIGNVSIIHRNNRQFEIQIVIGEKKCWGKGIGTKAISKTLRIAFDDLNYEVAYLEVRSNNTRAIKAYEKNSFVTIGGKKSKSGKMRTGLIKMKLLKKRIV